MLDFLRYNLPYLLVLLPAIAAVAALVSRRPTAALAVTLAAAALHAATTVLAMVLLAGEGQAESVCEWVRLWPGRGVAFHIDMPRATALLAPALAAPTIAFLTHRKNELTPARTAIGLLMHAGVVGAILSADLLLLCMFVEWTWLMAVILVAVARGPGPASRLMLPCLLVTTALLAVVLWLGWLHNEATGVVSFAYDDLLHTDEYLLGRPPATMDIFETAIIARLAGWVVVYVAGLAGMLAAMRRALRAETLKAAAKALAVAQAGLVVLTAAPAVLPEHQAADGWVSPHHVSVAYLAIGAALGWLGLMVCAAYIGRSGRRLAEPQDIRGLARKYPGMTFAAGVCLISLAGMPISAGFIWRLMALASSAGTGALLVMLLLLPPMVALAATYLSMLLAAAFIGKPAPQEHISLPGARGAVWRVLIAAIAAILVLLGILPQLLMEPLRAALGG